MCHSIYPVLSTLFILFLLTIRFFFFFFFFFIKYFIKFLKMTEFLRFLDRKQMYNRAFHWYCFILCHMLFFNDNFYWYHRAKRYHLWINLMVVGQWSSLSGTILWNLVRFILFCTLQVQTGIQVNGYLHADASEIFKFTYTSFGVFQHSPICIAAQHTGSLPNTDSLVLWKHMGKPTTFTRVLSNGILSSA